MDTHSSVPPRDESELNRQELAHMQAEHLAWWADPEDVRAHLNDPKRMRDLVSQFSRVLLQARLLFENMGCPKDQTYVFPCTGCNTPYEHELQHNDTGPRIIFHETWNARSKIHWSAI